MNCPSCHTPTDKHEPGRELDKCVAEARGWRRFDMPVDSDAVFVNCRAQRGEAGHKIGWQKSSNENPRCEDCEDANLIPHFSSSFAACEGLIEEMVRDDKFRVEVSYHKDATKVAWFSVQYGFQHSLEAPTRSLALSLFYLIFKGKEKGDG